MMLWLLILCFFLFPDVTEKAVNYMDATLTDLAPLEFTRTA